MKKLSNLLAAATLAVCIGGGLSLLAVSCSNASSGSGGGGGSVTYTVGDIVFKDGSIMAYADFAALSSTEKGAKNDSAVAVIFDATNKLGVGLYPSLAGWCISTATAYNANQYATSLTDGKANTDQIKGLSDYSETNYPAFHYAANYGATRFAGTSYASGWYLPAKDELQKLCDAQSTVRSVFKGLSQYNNLPDTYYFSSSQITESGNEKNAWQLYFSDGNWQKTKKDITEGYICLVCAIRKF